MASLFKQRKPKRIVSSASDDPGEDEDTGPVVRRPGSSKPKSKLRVAFDPEQDQDADSSNFPSENDTAHIKPPKPRPSTALQDKLRETSLRERDYSEDVRPSYSKSYLDELRNSTPSTPLSLTTTTPPSTDQQHQLDISSKFPNAPSLSSSSHIPTSTEIAAAKARRLRAAHEANASSQDFIPLDDNQLYDSDGEFKPQRLQVGTYIPPSAHEKDTRLIPDDEELLEGFETFTEDINPGGRITMDMSKRAERARLKASKDSIRQQIATAEQQSDSDASEGYDSDDQQLHAQYEAAQFNAGLDGLRSAHSEHTRMSKRQANRQPKVTVPIEKLSTGLARLREQVARIELERGQLERRKGEIERERAELQAQREHVQRSLEEASRELEGLQARSGPTATAPARGNGERGLDTLGTRVEADDGDEGVS